MDGQNSGFIREPSMQSLLCPECRLPQLHSHHLRDRRCGAFCDGCKCPHPPRGNQADRGAWSVQARWEPCVY